MRQITLALSLTGLIAISPAGSIQAAPLTALSAAANSAEQRSVVRDDLTRVHWRGGWGIGAGLVAGALIGSAIATPHYYAGYRLHVLCGRVSRGRQGTIPDPMHPAEYGLRRHLQHHREDRDAPNRVRRGDDPQNARGLYRGVPALRGGMRKTRRDA